MDQLNIIAKADSEKVSALPKFVVEDHPKFVAFLRAYYEWSAQNGADLGFEALKLSNDIDLVPDVLLEGYRNTYAPNLPLELKTDFRHFSKFLKEFYQLRGTPEGFDILFNALFGKVPTIVFPRDQVFKPSHNTWVVSTTVDVVGDCSNTEGLNVVGSLTGHKNTINTVDDQTLTFEYPPKFTISESLMVEDGRTLVINPVWEVASVTAKDSNLNYYDGQEFTSDGLNFRVNKVHYGYVVDLEIQNAGSNYQVSDQLELVTEHQGSGFQGEVTAVGSSGQIQSVRIIRAGFGYDSRSGVIKVKSNKGRGAVIAPTYNPEMMSIKSVSLKTKAPAALATRAVELPDTTITLKRSPVFQVKHWGNQQSMPSTQYAKIHDSNYYQEYSYVVNVDGDVSAYEDTLKKLVHVAGLRMFFNKPLNYQPV